LIVLSFPFLSAQYGYGNGYGKWVWKWDMDYGGYGRQRNSIPQAQENAQGTRKINGRSNCRPGNAKHYKKKLGLNPFEEAVLSTNLKKYLQERIELQILELPADKMRESYEEKLPKSRMKNLWQDYLQINTRPL